MISQELNGQFETARRHSQAVDRCNRLMQQATLYDLWRRLCDEAIDLRRFDEIAPQIHRYPKTPCGIRSIPLQQIVGSVGRSRDFTRDFLPRRSVSQQRWARIDLAFGEALPAVDLYQVGEIYFVVDGHHRISVARARGCQQIEANITKVLIPISVFKEDKMLNPWIAGDLAATYQQDRTTARAHRQLLRQARPKQNLYTGLSGPTPQRWIRSILARLAAWRWRRANPAHLVPH